MSLLGRRHLPPALALDLPVLVLLVVCWLTVSVALAHLLTGLALIAVIAVHLGTRPRRLFRRGRRRTAADAARRYRRLAFTVTFVVLTAAMVVSGLLRWAGLPPEHTYHGGLSYAMLSVAVLHLWVERRALRARLRRPRRRAARSEVSSRQPARSFP